MALGGFTVRSHIPHLYRTSLVAQTVKHLSTMQETQVQSLGQEDPLCKLIRQQQLIGPVA